MKNIYLFFFIIQCLFFTVLPQPLHYEKSMFLSFFSQGIGFPLADISQQRDELESEQEISVPLNSLLEIITQEEGVESGVEEQSVLKFNAEEFSPLLDSTDFEEDSLAPENLEFLEIRSEDGNEEIFSFLTERVTSFNRFLPNLIVESGATEEGNQEARSKSQGQGEEGENLEDDDDGSISASEKPSDGGDVEDDDDGSISASEKSSDGGDVEDDDDGSISASEKWSDGGDVEDDDDGSISASEKPSDGGDVEDDDDGSISESDELPYYFDLLFTSSGERDRLQTALNEVSETPPVLPKKKRERYPLPKRFQATHSEENGVGNAFGYTTMGLVFGPAYALGKVMPLVDISGAVFNDGTYAASAGLIFRYIPKNTGIIPGINVYYDARPARGLYQDVGVGLELLGPWADFRANGYSQVGKGSSVRKEVCDDYIGSYFTTSKAHQFNFSGGDAEVGFLPVNAKGGFLLYVAGGPYYLHSKQIGGVWGVQGRIQPQYKDYLALRMTVSSDRLFGTIVQGEALFSLPLYDFTDLKKQKGPGGISNRQIYQPVERRPFVPLGNRCCWKSNF